MASGAKASWRRRCAAGRRRAGPPPATARPSTAITVELRTWRDVGHFDIPKVAAADVAA
jgi:hypothetical protein